MAFHDSKSILKLQITFGLVFESFVLGYMLWFRILSSLVITQALNIPKTLNIFVNACCIVIWNDMKEQRQVFNHLAQQYYKYLKSLSAFKLVITV